MNLYTATSSTTATTTYTITPEGLDLINYFFQFLTLFAGVIVGLVVFYILIFIYKV